MASSPNKSVKRAHTPTPTNFPEIVLVLFNNITTEIKLPINKGIKYIIPTEYKIVFMIFILDSSFSFVYFITFQFEEPYIGYF